MGKRWTVIAAAAATLALGAPAGAQPQREPAPVAGPTPGGVRMAAVDESGRLCLSFSWSRRGDFTSCASAPSLREPRLETDSFSARASAFLGGAVVSEVSAVEVVLADGSRLAAATSAGEAYDGRHAGKTRFFLVDLPARADPVYVRQLDQAGTLLAAAEVDPYDSSSRRDRVTLVEGRTGRLRWRLAAYVRPRLLPLPGEEERVVDEACLGWMRAYGRDSISTEAVCADPDGAGERWPLSVNTECRGAGLSAVGLAPPEATRLEAVLGSGRRVRVPIRALPARFGGWRAFALVAGPQVALRKLVGFEDGRARLLARGIAPGVANCPDTSSSFFFVPGLLREPRFGAGGPALQVTDRGTLLCTTIGLPRPAVDCWRPPVAPDESRLFWHPSDAGTYAAGVLSDEVASVSFVLDGGERHVVPTTPAGPYTGRYQGVLRFFTASFPGRRELVRVAFLDAFGRMLARRRGYREPLLRAAPGALLRSRGLRLTAGALHFDPRRRPLPCLQFARRGFTQDWLQCRGVEEPSLLVSCRPRVTFVFGRVGSGVRVVELATDRGAFGARTAQLPRSLGIRGRVFLATLPAAARPRRLLFDGKPEGRRIRLPAAAKQCGYSASLD